MILVQFILISYKNVNPLFNKFDVFSLSVHYSVSPVFALTLIEGLRTEGVVLCHVALD